MRRQVDLYSDTRPFTAFETVSPDTPLELLNLNWRERDLPERLRTKHVHRLHPYLGKFIPQLVEIFLRKYARRVVCDPFMGSGTTLVEANALGYDAVGCDISVFNCLLAGVKTASYDLPLLGRELKNILTATELRVDPRSLYCEKMPATDNPYLRQWFAPPALGELLAYRDLIPRYRYQEVMKVILSRAARSARLTTHFDLDFPREPQRKPYYCHKHRRTCQPTIRALPFLRRYTLDTLRRVAEFAGLRTGGRVEIFWGDAREVPFPPCDTVITSPPYAGLIDYHEQHRYAFELLGLPDYSPREIGRTAMGISRSAVAGYLEGISAVFRNVKRSLCPGGTVVIVVHDRDHLYPDLAATLGFEVEAVLQRHVNRRTGRRAGEFYEQVYIWRNPG